MRETDTRRFALARTFASSALCYWLEVFPAVRRELHEWQRCAGDIPDPALRSYALATLRAKRGNVEGAAAFTTLSPRPQRPGVVRLLVAFQALHDYLDTVSEQPVSDLLANGRRLHRALDVALDPAADHIDYYALSPHRSDDGYLRAFVETCRGVVAELPAFPLVAPAVRRAAALTGDAQSLLHAGVDGGGELARWAARQAPPGVWLRGWEIGAAACSTLTVYALLAAAANPDVTDDEVAAIEAAYFPWMTGLSTLLDSLIDRSEDAVAGSHSHVESYASAEEAAERLGALAATCAQVTRHLRRGERHAVLLAGMVGYYLSAPEASVPPAGDVRRRVLSAIGGLAWPALLVFRVKRRAERRPPAPEGALGEP